MISPAPDFQTPALANEAQETAEPTQEDVSENEGEEDGSLRYFIAKNSGVYSVPAKYLPPAYAALDGLYERYIY